MRILYDTSILVAGLVQAHPQHEIALDWLQKAKNKQVEPFICTHTLAESYAVLTRLPVTPKISPETARYLLHHILEVFKKVALTPADYMHAIGTLTELGLSGGIVYDALILRAAHKVKVNKILTFNRQDFVRLCLGKESFVLTP